MKNKNYYMIVKIVLKHIHAVLDLLLTKNPFSSKEYHCKYKINLEIHEASTSCFKIQLGEFPKIIIQFSITNAVYMAKFLANSIRSVR